MGAFLLYKALMLKGLKQKKAGTINTCFFYKKNDLDYF